MGHQNVKSLPHTEHLTISYIFSCNRYPWSLRKGVCVASHADVVLRFYETVLLLHRTKFTSVILDNINVSCSCHPQEYVRTRRRRRWAASTASWGTGRRSGLLRSSRGLLATACTRHTLHTPTPPSRGHPQACGRSRGLTRRLHTRRRWGARAHLLTWCPGSSVCIHTTNTLHTCSFLTVLKH